MIRPMRAARWQGAARVPRLAHGGGMFRLKSWLEAGLGFFYPPVCRLCYQEAASAAEGYVGSQCRRQVRFIRPPLCGRCGLPVAGAVTTDFVCGNCRGVRLHFRSARAAAAAEGVVLEVIHRYKYDRALWFEPFLVGLLTQAALPILGQGRWNLVVPVPLHPARRREREFNQAERLAAALAQASGLPMDAQLLRRVRWTSTQTRFSREARQRNMGQAFELRSGRLPPRARVVLVDDVLTTGATCNACAAALRRAGAREVCVWTVARGL